MEKENGQQNAGDLQRAYRTAYLVAAFIRETLTEEERDELDEWIIESKENMHLFGELTAEENIAESIAAFERMDAEEGLREAKMKMRRYAKKKQRKTILPWQWAAAAAIIVTIGLTFMLVRYYKANSKNKQVAIAQKDLNPGSDNAVLTLANGDTMRLGSKSTSNAETASMKLELQNGQVTYLGDSTASDANYHLLAIPRKGQYKLILPDGTKVWLNSESTIRFPLSFGSTERKVFVSGETYFEVAKDKARPFRVEANGMMIEALGTQFNINAYNDEIVTQATLTEGSIKVTAGNQQQILIPGEQAVLDGARLTSQKIEVADIVAWKNNEFKFHNTSLDIIMRQVARWYDAEVIFKDKIDVHLNATIERGVPVSKLLKLLEATGHVKFKIEENKIIVTR